MKTLERQPHPFFFSVEFLTILVKTIATLSLAYPAMAAVGLLTIPSGFLFLGAIAQGLLDARNEINKHGNLYSDLPFIRGKAQAITNITLAQATEIAKTSHSTLDQVLQTPSLVASLVDLTGKPSLAKSGVKLISKLFGG
jgi:hypothetical protein